ncbi:uncharacterized protein LOC131166150 [Malania oleifera]|uniref:uncharacterized protein LOC131166150 n=1 Tax=Malania oleifera TaxID=397392 RepID=UPI0025ADA310|nr:uncharacterized protein LOC131166150 [Malania oleifera]
MMRSPGHPNYERGNSAAYVFDPQVNFSRVLEEARKHAREGNAEVSSPYQDKPTEKNMNKVNKNSKKSWKNSLFSWWKVEKKSRPDMEPARGLYAPKLRRGYASGPIFGSRENVERRPWCPSSGFRFNPGKREQQNAIPYMHLDQLDPHAARTYGPLYLVT